LLADSDPDPDPDPGLRSGSLGVLAPAGILAYGGTLYVTDGAGDVASLPIGGGAVTTLVQGPGQAPGQTVSFFVPGLAVDDANV
jgi:hypothetical protein